MKYLTLIIVSLILPFTAVAQIYYSEAHNIEVTDGSQPIEDPFTGGFNTAQFSGIDLNQDGIMYLVVTDRFRNTVKPY